MTQLENVVEAIADCEDRSVRRVLQEKIPALEAKRVSLGEKVLELKQSLSENEYDPQTLDLSSALSLLRDFRKNLDKQPLSVQAQLLSRIVKESRGGGRSGALKDIRGGKN